MQYVVYIIRSFSYMITYYFDQLGKENKITYSIHASTTKLYDFFFILCRKLFAVINSVHAGLMMKFYRTGWKLERRWWLVKNVLGTDKGRAAESAGSVNQVPVTGSTSTLWAEVLCAGPRVKDCISPVIPCTKGSFVPASDLMSEIIIYMKPKSEFFCTFETIPVSMV